MARKLISTLILGGFDDKGVRKPLIGVALYRDARKKAPDRWTLRIGDTADGVITLNEQQFETLAEAIGTVYKQMREEDEKLAKKKPRLRIIK